MNALDVGEDQLVKDHAAGHRVDEKALDDWLFIRRIQRSEAQDHEKCAALLLLLQGAPYSEATKKLPAKTLCTA